MSLPARIDWHTLSAEEVVHLLEGRPVVLGPWTKDLVPSGGTLWSRIEECPLKEPLRRWAVYVGTTRGRRGNEPTVRHWFVDVGYRSRDCTEEFETTFHDSEEEALAAADKSAIERGWKLMKGKKT